MERSEILEMMGQLQLSGMRGAYDEIVTAGIKRSHGIERVIGALLKAEIAEKEARSIRYQMGIAKLPLAKELADFTFAGTPINEQLVRDLAGGGFLAQQRNVVAIGGTGTGKTHLSIAIARSCIRAGKKTRFFNVIDLVNKLEAEVKLGRAGRIADGLTRALLLHGQQRLGETGLCRGSLSAPGGHPGGAGCKADSGTASFMMQPLILRSKAISKIP
jgi:DNA replication protein DnaC